MLPFPGSTIVYGILAGLILFGVVYATFLSLATYRTLRNGGETWAEAARRRRNREALTSRMLLLEHELGIFGHECGPLCPARVVSTEEVWKALLRKSSAGRGRAAR